MGLSVRRLNDMGSLWTQLLLQFLTNLFETLQVFLSLSEDTFCQRFPLFQLSFFPGQITIRIDTLWAQLLLEFSTDHFETMHTYST